MLIRLRVFPYQNRGHRTAQRAPTPDPEPETRHREEGDTLRVTGGQRGRTRE